MRRLARAAALLAALLAAPGCEIGTFEGNGVLGGGEIVVGTDDDARSVVFGSVENQPRDVRVECERYGLPEDGVDTVHIGFADAIGPGGRAVGGDLIVQIDPTEDPIYPRVPAGVLTLWDGYGTYTVRFGLDIVDTCLIDVFEYSAEDGVVALELDCEESELITGEAGPRLRFSADLEGCQLAVP